MIAVTPKTGLPVVIRMEDASLDEFLGGGDGERDEIEATTSDDEAGSADDEGEATEEETVEPVRATYQWSPGGLECASCGGTVDRCWHSETGLVCAECKGW